MMRTGEFETTLELLDDWNPILICTLKTNPTALLSTDMEQAHCWWNATNHNGGILFCTANWILA